jgi:hypothetical protein
MTMWRVAGKPRRAEQVAVPTAQHRRHMVDQANHVTGHGTGGAFIHGILPKPKVRQGKRSTGNTLADTRPPGRRAGRSVHPPQLAMTQDRAGPPQARPAPGPRSGPSWPRGAGAKRRGADTTLGIASSVRNLRELGARPHAASGDSRPCQARMQPVSVGKTPTSGSNLPLLQPTGAVTGELACADKVQPVAQVFGAVGPPRHLATADGRAPRTRLAGGTGTSVNALHASVAPLRRRWRNVFA